MSKGLHVHVHVACNIANSRKHSLSLSPSRPNEARPADKVVCLLALACIFLHHF